MALSRSAAGSWCGASHGGHASASSVVPTAGPSSSARAAQPASARAGAWRLPRGRSATASGSGTGTSCSARIRGGSEVREGTAVDVIELERISDGVVGGLAARAKGGECGPHR